MVFVNKICNNSAWLIINFLYVIINNKYKIIIVLIYHNHTTSGRYKKSNITERSSTLAVVKIRLGPRVNGCVTRARIPRPSGFGRTVGPSASGLKFGGHQNWGVLEYHVRSVKTDRHGKTDNWGLKRRPRIFCPTLKQWRISAVDNSSTVLTLVTNTPVSTIFFFCIMLPLLSYIFLVRRDVRYFRGIGNRLR